MSSRVLDGRAITLRLSCTVRLDGCLPVDASDDYLFQMIDGVPLMSTSTGDCLQTLAVHEDAVTSAVYSADGSSVLTASDDVTAKIRSTSTGDCLQTFTGHADALTSAVYLANGSSVLTASYD